MPFYAKNQLVWAKIKGYPWWPAIVAKSNQTRNGNIEDEVLVNFIGENSHAVVAMDKIADFEESFEEHSSSKNKRLAESIKTAQRILEGVSTYEEEKGRLLKRLAKPEKEEKEEKSPQKPKPMKLIKKKDIEPKESPKAGRPGQKSKDKESRLDKKYELLEYMPQRATRSRSKQENIEMLTEPLIYSSRKSHRSPIKGGKRRLTRSSIRRSNRRGGAEENHDDEDSEDDESGDEDEEDDEENEEEDSDDEEEDEEEVERRKVTKKLRRTSRSAVRVAPPSKATIKRRTRGGGRRPAKKTPVSKKRKGSEEEESKRSDNDTPVSLMKETRAQRNKGGKVETEQDIELEKMLEDVDDDDCESFDLDMDVFLNQDMKGQDKKYNERSTGDNKDGHYANSSTKTVMAYNSLKIRKFENDLEQLLNKMSKKFLSKDKLQEEDPVLLHLLNVIQEFDNNTFNGVEFINSDLGKLFKTVHFIFTKNKDLLCKTADQTIPRLAKVLHKIKNKIIQHCLDNSDYIESLNLPDEQRENTRQPITMAAINVDENRTKVEESGISPPHNTSNGPIITKMEDEENMRRTRSMQANSATKKEEMMPATSNINKQEKQQQQQQQQQQQEGPQTQQVSNFQLRKKICQKFAALLQRAYSMERGRSQELTLQIEEKINNFYLTNVNDYKQAIKRLLKIIKAGKLEEEELIQIQDLKLNEFTTMLKQKLDTITNFVESPEPSVSTAAEAKSDVHNGQNQKHNKAQKENNKEAKETGVPTRKSTRSSTKEAPSMESNNIVTKLDDVHGPIIKEEPERASYEIIPITSQPTQFQQKIEFV